MANRSLYRHAPNWFPTLLALQDTVPLHTTWQYSDLIAVVYIVHVLVIKYVRPFIIDLKYDSVFSFRIMNLAKKILVTVIQISPMNSNKTI